MFGNKVFFFFDVSLLRSVIFLILFLINFVLEKIMIEISFVSRYGLIFQNENNGSDLAKEFLVMGDDKEGFWVVC